MGRTAYEAIAAAMTTTATDHPFAAGDTATEVDELRRRLSPVVR